MSLDNAIKFAKNVGADKVPFRFQFPVDIKEEFEELCEKYKVSMTWTFIIYWVSIICT